MSETIIQKAFRLGGVLTDMTSVVLRDPTNTFGLRRTDTLEVLVAAGAAFTHVSTGVYQFIVTDPAPNLTYNYWVEFVFAGETTRLEKFQSGSTGGGVAPADIPDALPRSCISLARYAKLTGYSECAINGVAVDGETYGECENPLWSQFQRDTLLYYLAEAQEEIEQVTGYPLCPTYFADEYHALRTRNAFPLHARWMKVLAAGVRAESAVLAAAAIDYSIEPALIGPLATGVTDPSEIHVFYPGSAREIEPSKVTLSAGSVRIWIPRCRLVTPAAFDTPPEGLAYDDLSNFLEAADVMRVSTDDSVNAQFVYAHRATAGHCPTCGCATCGEATAEACLYVSNPETGALDALRGTYAAGTWTAGIRSCYCAQPSGIRVNYLAGLDPITLQAENAVLRLAHAKMPTAPCGCGPLQDLWTRDRFVPEFIDEVRLSNPFGPSDGALIAYRFASAIANRRMSVI